MDTRRFRFIIREEVQRVLREFEEDNYWITPDGEVKKMDPGVTHADYVKNNLDLFFSEEKVKKLKNKKGDKSTQKWSYFLQKKAVQNGAIRIKKMEDFEVAIESKESSMRNNLDKVIQVGGENKYIIDIRREDGSIQSFRLKNLEELMKQFSGRGGTSSKSKVSRFR